MPNELQTPERKHHRYGMSGLNYIAACAGFVNHDNENEAAEDGDRLHGVMQKVIVAVAEDRERKTTAVAALRRVTEKETVSEDEEIYLEFCCKELDQWIPKVPTGSELIVERRVYIRHENGEVLNYGHFDLMVFIVDEIGILFDYKFGWIPVPPAVSNWQGKGYATGAFQEFPKLKKIGVVFVQPKLHKVTRVTYLREDTYKFYREIRGIIEAAQAPQKRLSPGQYCDYCAHASKCSALLNEAQKALAVYEGLPIPTGFAGLQINSAEDAAKAMYVLDRLEVLLEKASDLKAMAKQFARDQGGVISAPLPDGRSITVSLHQKNAGRSAHHPVLIADVLKDHVTLEQVLSACDPKITALEDIFADAFVEKQKAEAKSFLDDAEAQAQRLEHSGDHTGAAQVRKEAKASAKSMRVTRKLAKEILNDTLLAEGLVSRPDSKVEYLKVRVEKPATTNQIPNGQSHCEKSDASG
jgi:hypothetical protein